MAFSSLLRRASSTVLPLAIRAVASPRACHRAISTVENSGLCRELNRRFVAPFARFSTKPSSDENLIRILETEIECAEKPNDKIPEYNPKSFPFEIEDNSGERTICLTREYGDEVIKVEVDIPTPSATEEDEEAEEEDEEGDSIPMVVTISKGSGPHLEFGVTAFVDQIVIDSFSIKHSEDSDDQLAYEGPDFGDLDENLQKALREYLENRGINTSTAAFLLEYMTNKDAKEYLVWLENLRKFIEK